MTVPTANPRPDREIERVLVVVAHPDDIDFGGAGTVALWTGAGIEVSYCIVTDGQAGGFEPERDRAEMPAVRRAEQTAAAAHVGVRDLHFLGYEDGYLEPTRELVADIVRVIRKVRPQRLLGAVAGAQLVAAARRRTRITWPRPRRRSARSSRPRAIRTPTRRSRRRRGRPASCG